MRNKDVPKKMWPQLGNPIYEGTDAKNFGCLSFIYLFFFKANSSLGVSSVMEALQALCWDYLKVVSLQARSTFFFFFPPFHSVSWPIGGCWRPALLSALSPKTPGSTETGNGNSIALPTIHLYPHFSHSE